MKKSALPVLAGISLAMAIVLVVSNRPRAESTSPPSPPPARPYEHAVAAVGLVETSTENIAVGTPISDVVVEVPVVVGQAVKVGDPLFRLDDRQFRADLAARRAEVTVAESEVKVDEAALEDLKRELGFAERVADRRAISEEEVTRRRSAVETAQARLGQARARVLAAAAQVKVVETMLERSVVRASIEGQVLQVKIHPGEFAPAGVTGTPLVLLGRPKPLYIRVDVDEHEAWRVRPDARGTAAVRGNPDQKTDLAFVRFEPFVIPKKSLTGDSTERVDTRVLQILYRIEDEGLPLFVGQQMDVFIKAEATRVAKAP
jgi:multidrug efflux pump subunit AcrA (membrane-fusion protein)